MIEPALTAEEWAEYERYSIDYMIERASGGCEYGKVIALANAELPDDDPRKLTHEMVQSIRDAAQWIDLAYDSPSETERRKPWIAAMQRYAAALQSYLPPREPNAEG